MKYLLGIKKGMTQVFDETGACHPATILEIPSTVVKAVKTAENDGYSAIKVGAGEQKEHRLSKAQKGTNGTAQFVREFRVKGDNVDTSATEIGSTISLDQFTVGDTVQVSATSKGKGFQGVVKRHGFSGGPKTHGNKHHERAAGSIGSAGIGRVFKGTRMAGRMGGERITVKNLTVVQIQPDKQLLVVKGPVPGRNGALVEVRG